MVRGKRFFICSECGNKFMGPDIEYAASTFSMPLKCEKCGSMHTRPWNVLDVVPAFRKVGDKRYKAIWESYDKS